MLLLSSEEAKAVLIAGGHVELLLHQMQKGCSADGLAQAHAALGGTEAHKHRYIRDATLVERQATPNPIIKLDFSSSLKICMRFGTASFYVHCSGSCLPPGALQEGYTEAMAHTGAVIVDAMSAVALLWKIFLYETDFFTSLVSSCSASCNVLHACVLRKDVGSECMEIDSTSAAPNCFSAASVGDINGRAQAKAYLHEPNGAIGYCLPRGAIFCTAKLQSAKVTWQVQQIA